MSTRPTTPKDTPASVASSASSQKTTAIGSETSSDRVAWGPGSFTQSSYPHLYPRPPPVVFMPSRAPPTELPTMYHPYSETAVRHTDPPRDWESDWFRCASGRSGRTAHITGIICVVVVITIILVVILILSLLSKNKH
ncbi:hypothetical protein F4859DRAFT_510947 [Xylaria cf. heliscus]|nr:hypothetical protein F4859DRAFT_510947 [Xylaria cf. heliscus]